MRSDARKRVTLGDEMRQLLLRERQLQNSHTILLLCIHECLPLAALQDHKRELFLVYDPFFVKLPFTARKILKHEIQKNFNPGSSNPSMKLTVMGTIHLRVIAF